MIYKTRESVEWKDNIGQELHAGDYIFSLNGKYSFEIVKKLSTKYDGIFGFEPTVVFQDGRTMYACYVLSLTALDISPKTNAIYNSSGFDALGNKLNVGDIVLSVPRLEMFAEKGKVLKVMPKNCKISHEPNRFETDFHMRKYNEIISLTAINKENLEIQHD